MKDIIFGIDLGTTNSCIAYVDHSTPVVIENKEGKKTTPSVVAFKKIDGHIEVEVGEKAKNQLISNPNATVASVKRSMGSGKKYLIYDHQYTPEEISGDILRYLYNFASQKLHTTSNKVVITVPAYFDEVQRQATIDAGKIAGLNVVKIINEPTAAALAYGINKKNEKQIVLVYDLGGGTFDVSILQIGNKDKNGNAIFEVLATNGNKHLGGDDWDQVVMDDIVNQIQNEYLVDLRNNKQAMQRIKEAAEHAKIELSSSENTHISLPFIGKTKNGVAINFECDLSRKKFNQMTKFLLDQTIDPVKEAIASAKITIADLNEVLLVGGSTRMPAVDELVKQLTGREPNRSINPDEVVAIGAAIQGAMIAGDIVDIILDDITPLSLGTIVVGDRNVVIVPKNTPIPFEITSSFTTAYDDQTAIKFRVTQGERLMGKDNIILGDFTLKNIPPALAGEPEITVTYAMNENGILHVKAFDEQTHQEISTDIENSSNLSDDEINKIMKEAEENRQRDEIKNRQALVDYLAHKKLDDLKKSLKDDNLSIALTNRIRQQIKQIETLLDNKDYSKLEELVGEE